MVKKLPKTRFDPPGLGGYSLPLAVKRTIEAGQHRLPDLELIRARFDRARVYALGLAVCPEKKEKSYDSVRIRTLRTQQRANKSMPICGSICHAFNSKKPVFYTALIDIHGK
ncbi:hypothetical protein LBMAG08_01230 [Actinomycetes bacterium]|nr:hypothetical protein LBMAG08_01230 [Actinomycetes bacterium]